MQTDVGKELAIESLKYVMSFLKKIEEEEAELATI